MSEPRDLQIVNKDEAVLLFVLMLFEKSMNPSLFPLHPAMVKS